MSREMDAYVLHGIGDFRLEKAGMPVPGRNQALVKVKAAGICGSDIPRIYKTGTYSYPLIPGHEFSGVVTEAGPGVDRGWVGKRTGVFPLIPCGSCNPCRQKEYELCRSYGYLGSRTDGGFAGYVKVPVWNLMELPDTVSFEAAAMMEPMAVAVHALRISGLEDAGNDERVVAICGLGTIGLLLLMFVLETGASKVLVIGNKDAQMRLAAEAGVAGAKFCDVRREDAGQWLLEHTDGNGVDVFFDCVGKNETLLYAIRCAAPGGRLCLVGNPASDMRIGKEAYWAILRNQLTLSGSWNSSFRHDRKDDWNYVLERAAKGKVKPEGLISHRFSFEELGKGFELMRDKSEDFVKVMGIS